jgi:hypothetical protein
MAKDLCGSIIRDSRRRSPDSDATYDTRRLSISDPLRVMHVRTVRVGLAPSGSDGIVAGQRPFYVRAGSGPFEGVRRRVAPVVAPIATRPRSRCPAERPALSGDAASGM